MALKRIMKDLEDMKREPIDLCSADPSGSDMFRWTAMIKGPPNSPYEGGKFYLDIIFPKLYPLKPPGVTFKTKVFHPNISITGRICLDILNKLWSPALSIQQVLISIVSLLCDPNPLSPLSREPAKLFQENRQKYDKVAKEWTKNFAKT